MPVGIEETEVVPVYRKRNRRALSRSKSHLLEPFQFFYRSGKGRLPVADVHLDSFTPGAVSRIGNLYSHCHSTVNGHFRTVQFRFTVLEGGIAQTVAECEQRPGLLLHVGPSVSDIYTVFVFYIHGIPGSYPYIFSEDMCRDVLSLQGM